MGVAPFPRPPAAACAAGSVCVNLRFISLIYVKLKSPGRLEDAGACRDPF
jgi:hypothetical protein